MAQRPLVWGSPTQNKPRGAPPAHSTIPACQPHLSPHSIQIQRNLTFSSWKTKHKAGRKCCSRLTPATAPKSPPFIFHVATSKPPAREIFASLGLARARGWREEFGVECYSPASSGHVPASGDTQPREHSQAGPWELARPPGQEPWEGLLGSQPWRCLGAGSFPLPDRQLVPSQIFVALDGVTVTQLSCFNSRLPPGPKNKENYMGLPLDGGFDPG